MTDAARSEPAAPGCWDRIPSWSLVLLVAAVYWPTLRGGFIGNEDVLFAANPRLFSFRGLLDIWTTRTGFDAPLACTTFWLLRRVVGLVPWVYHGLAIALHIATALTLRRILRAMAIPGALPAAAIFALHPVQVEAVAWIGALPVIQSAFFLVCAVRALFRSGLLPNNQLLKRRWLGTAMAFYLAALLSNLSVVVLPVVLLLFLWWRDLLRAARDAWWVMPFAGAALFIAVWVSWVQGWASTAATDSWLHGFPDRLVTAGRLLTFYFGKLVWPHPLCFMYPNLELSATEMRAWLPLFAVLVAVVGVWINRKDWGRSLLFVGSTYLLFHLPELGLFRLPGMGEFRAADHLQYIPLLAPAAWAGALMHRLDRWSGIHIGGVSIARTAVAAWLIAYTGAAWHHARVFQSSEHLWIDTVRKNPLAWRAQNNLGLIYRDRGQHEDAERRFRAALAANPHSYEALCNLGAAVLRRGRIVEARLAFEEAIRRQPNLPKAWFYLGRVHEKTGNWEAAEMAFLRTLEIQPGYAEAHARLAIRYEELEIPSRALMHHRRALELATPDRREWAKFLNQRTARLISRQRWEMARAFLDAAREMDPGFEETRQLESIWHNLLPESSRGE